MSAQLTAATRTPPVPRPRPRPHHTIPVEQIPEIEPLLSGARILPSCNTASVQDYLVTNYDGTPVICRVEDQIYYYDGTKFSVSPVGDPDRFLNHVDASEGAVSAWETASRVGFITRDTSVGKAPSGSVFDNVTEIKVLVLSSANGWFDTFVCDPVTGTILCYNKKSCGSMTHSGDNPNGQIEEKNHHELVFRGVDGPCFFGVVGFNGKELRQFTDQFNLVKMTFADGAEKWITCEWDFTPVNIGDARVAGIFSVDKNADGTMKVKVHFESYSKRDFNFNTGSTCDSSKDFARRYLRAVGAVPSRTSVAASVDAGRVGVDTTHVSTTEAPCLVTSGPIPEILKTSSLSLELEVTEFHPGIFGGNTGVSNLAYPGGELVSGDYPTVVYINNPDDIHQSILELAKSRRCVLILKVTGGMEKINDVTLYACRLMTPQSTLIIFDDTVDKFYHVSGPFRTKEVDDSVNIRGLIQYHLDNPAGFPLLTDGKIYTSSGVLTPDEMIERIHEFLDYIDQLQMCISPDKWKEVFKSMLVSIDSHKKEIRKLAKGVRFRMLGLKMKKSNKKTSALISQDLATLVDKLSPLDQQLKGIKDIARFILKYQYHPMSSKTFGSSKKLSGDVQAQLRNLSTKALKDRIQQMLADSARFSEEIEDLLESLGGDVDGWMVIGDPQKSVLDGPTVAVCNEMAPGSDLHIVLPNQGGQVFIPVPVHIEYVNLVEAYQAGHDIYLYMGLLSASKFVTGSQNPFDDEPLYKMIRWLMESHDNLAATLSASYTPDDDNTTTKVLKTLRFLVVAVWKGFRDGMFRPELSRFGGIIPADQVPSGRVPFKDYSLQEALWYARAIQKSSTNPAEMRSFMARILGDLCKSIWSKYIQPIEHILKGEKQQALAADAAACQDRSNLILRYQLYLFLKILYPTMDFEKAADTLFGSSEIPEFDLTPDTRRGHFKSTRALRRITGYTKLNTPSDEFQMLIQIFVSRVINSLPKDKTKKGVIETLAEKGDKAFGNMRRILESFLGSSDQFPFFSTGEFGDKITENFDKGSLLEAIRASTSYAAAAVDGAAVADGAALTPHQELMAFGLTEELATKLPMINPVTDIREISPLLEEKTLGITGDQIPEITKLVFKHWDNPDAGVREVLKMMNLW